MAIESGREVLANAAQILASYAQELERYATRYDDCGNDASVNRLVLHEGSHHGCCLFVVCEL